MNVLHACEAACHLCITSWKGAVHLFWRPWGGCLNNERVGNRPKIKHSRLMCCVAICLISILLSCGDKVEPQEKLAQDPVVPKPKPTIEKSRFVDVAQDLGLNFTYENGFDGRYFMPEIMGSGAALLDYDNDGDLDLYLVQGGHLLAQKGDQPVGDRLFRNDMEKDQPNSLAFTDVTEESGIRAFGYGQGVAVGDYNNDGFADLYVANFGKNQLWRNLGNGTFVEVSAETGIQDARWSVSASWLDFDRDGFLDLYIGNYCEYDPGVNEKCFSPRPDYCNPILFPAAPDSFWRNLGNGTFENITQASGIAGAFGRALGVIATDVNGDDLQDLYVANDLTANQLWINLGDGRFEDRGMMSGSGVVFNGLPGASMGVDAADFDNDGDEDLFMTHLTGQLNTLYVNDGTGNFRDRTQGLGLGGPSLPYTGFGTGFIDYDNDGWLDLVIANGAVKKRDVLIAAGNEYPFGERNQLYRNLNGKRFELDEEAGAAFEKVEISRGIAFGDLDNDGDKDMVMMNIAAPMQVLLNTHQGNQWVGFRLLGKEQHRDMVGTKITIEHSKGQMVHRQVRNDGSFASANDPRLLVGLGTGVHTVHVRVLWPDGKQERWPEMTVNRYWTLVQGEGEQTN